MSALGQLVNSSLSFFFYPNSCSEETGTEATDRTDHSCVQYLTRSFSQAKNLSGRVIHLANLENMGKTLKIGGLLVLILTPTFLPVAVAFTAHFSQDSRTLLCGLDPHLSNSNSLYPVNLFPFHVDNHKNRDIDIDILTQRLDDRINQECTTPSKLAASFGGPFNFAQLPEIPSDQIKIGSTGYPFVLKDAVSSRVMRGVDPMGRPLILVVYDKVNANNKQEQRQALLFQRYTDSVSNWVISGDRDFAPSGTLLHEDIHQLARLFNGLPLSNRYARGWIYTLAEL